MIAYRFESGQSIQLTTNSAFYRNVYKSTLLSVSNQCLEISVPYHNGIHIPLNVGFILNLMINTSQGICEFTTEVLHRNINSRSLVLKLPSLFNGEYSSAPLDFRNPGTRSSKFITVASGKGGVGKTSFIINYAITLAKKGKRVVILDADLGMANVDVLLKVTPKYNLMDVIEGSKSIKEIIVDAPGGIKLIPGGSGIQDLANLTPPQFYRITSGFGHLDKNFDYVLIDTGAGLSKNVMNFIHEADETIVLTTPEPHAITDAYSMIKAILDRNGEINMKLLINKCESLHEGEAVLNRISAVIRSFFGYSMTACGCILHTKHVSRSIKEQVPLCIAYPTCDTARNIEAIANAEIGSAEKSTSYSKISNFIFRLKSFFGAGKQ